ncbi:MAG TPA: mucoidy inhibitor MuiA family protein [Geomonas sp.]|nr:mucoidy inhibitor MuiA family protein [Geomonas sp.]
MRKSRIVLAFLSLLCCPQLVIAASHAVTAPSRIDSVTVFADRAQVSRSAHLSLKAGSNLVVFEGLPQLMSEESLRVDGKGTGPARIADISVKNTFLPQVPEQRVQELEKEVADLERKVQSIDARRKGLAAQEAFLESIRVGWGERISKELGMGKPSSSELGEAAKFVGDGINKVEEQLANAEVAKKPILERIAALKKELEQNREERMKEVRTVQVAIDADRDMEFSVQLNYLVGQARWEPTYDVRLAPDGKEAELVYRAQVWQKSGEDWPKVKLALSTARPEVGGAPPELVPWQVSIYEPPPPSPIRPLPAFAPMAGRSQGEAIVMEKRGRPSSAPKAAEPERAEPVAAQVEEGETSVLFSIPQPVTVNTDGTRSGCVIAVNKVPVAAEYVTVPKLSPRVYLKSEVTNSTPYPLLAGQANIFNDAVFTGKSYLKTVSAGEKFDLFFGADDQVKVRREVAKIRKKGGLLGSNSVSYRCTVELQNFKKRAVTVSLMDQLPLPGNAEITVKLEDASANPDERKPDGTLVWKVGLAAGEKKKITYDIVIDYPKDKELVGIQ